MWSLYSAFEIVRGDDVFIRALTARYFPEEKNKEGLVTVVFVTTAPFPNNTSGEPILAVILSIAACHVSQGPSFLSIRLERHFAWPRR